MAHRPRSRSRLVRAARGPIAIAPLAAIAALAIGCGGGDEDAGVPAEERPGDATTGAQPVEPEAEGSASAPVRSAIVAFLSSDDPALACDAATDRFLAAAFGDRAGCEAAQGARSAADAVRVRTVRQEEDAALAVAVPVGGPNDRERLRVELVLEEGGWLIDGIRSDAPVGP
jgi:hypothetical protein